MSATAKKLARAIALTETGGRQVHGASGEYGSFQFLPSTWRTVSNEVVGEVLPQTPLNEEYVAVKKIQNLLQRGHTEREVALIWNGSLGGSEKPIEKRGINQHGVEYDTPHDAMLVLTAYAAE